MPHTEGTDNGGEVNTMIVEIVRPACEGMPLEESERLFFKGGSRIEAEAKALCATCPAQAACLEFGMSAEFGIYGGLTARERDALDPNRVIVP